MQQIQQLMVRAVCAGVLIQKSCQAAAVSFMQLEGKDRVALVQQAFGIALNDHRQEQHHR